MLLRWGGLAGGRGKGEDMKGEVGIGGELAYPRGSPTTRNAISTVSAPARISSLEDSTISLSAMMTSRP